MNLSIEVNHFEKWGTDSGQVSIASQEGFTVVHRGRTPDSTVDSNVARFSYPNGGTHPAAFGSDIVYQVNSGGESVVIDPLGQIS